MGATNASGWEKKPFSVKEMTQDDFYDFSHLYKGPLVNRKLDPSGYPNWHHVRWLRYEKRSFGLLKFKTSLEDSDEFHSVSFRRRGKIPLILNPPLSYAGPVLISKEKKRDLIDLLPFISRTFWDFYENLKTAEDVVDVNPDLADVSEPEDSEEQ